MDSGSVGVAVRGALGPPVPKPSSSGSVSAALFSYVPSAISAASDIGHARYGAQKTLF